LYQISRAAILKNLTVSCSFLLSITFYNIAIFGPNDAAFEAISETLATLNSTELLDVLTMHVVAGEFPASAVIAAGCVELTTLGGTMVGVSYSEANGVMVNGATVILADVTGEGGIMHGIDSVLLGEFTPCPTEAPSSSPTESYESFLDLALAAGDYSTVLGAITDTPGVVEAVTAVLPVSECFACGIFLEETIGCLLTSHFSFRFTYSCLWPQ
jgi:hypothetical protein